MPSVALSSAAVQSRVSPGDQSGNEHAGGQQSESASEAHTVEDALCQSGLYKEGGQREGSMK